MNVLFKEFIKDESGDTNFISIIIILGIVVVLAGVFLAFKDQIVNGVKSMIDKFDPTKVDKNKTVW